jgi:hypothetical protein
MQVLRSVDLSVGDLKRDVKNETGQLHAKVDGHGTELRELLLALRAGIEIRLREIASAMERVGTATEANSAEIGKLRAAFSKVLVVSAMSLLAVILLVGVVLFR